MPRANPFQDVDSNLLRLRRSFVPAVTTVFTKERAAHDPARGIRRLLMSRLLVRKSLLAFPLLVLLEILYGATRLLLSYRAEAISIPKSPRIYLIHVGKAGGTTLTRTLLLDNTTVNGVNVAARAVRCILGSENKVDPDGNIVMKIGTDWKNASSFCYNHPPGASELARRTLGVFHMQGSPYSIDDNAWLMNNTNLFLFTVRDPIERLVSAYNYHWNIYKRYYSQVGGSPQLEKFYSQCFNRGIDSMVNDMRNGTSLDCLMMGVKWLLGKIIDGEEHSEFNYEYYWKYALGERPTITDGAEHFEFNYEYYWRYALGQRPNRPVAVLRTEHLWEDVIHMDQAIGGTGYFGNVEGFKFSHGSENYTKSQGTDFGASNTVFLCCLISREIEYYQRLILKAVNLSDKQKRESLHDLLNRCHIKEYSSWLSGVRKRPFSWRLFRQGKMCSELDSLSTSLMQWPVGNFLRSSF